MEIAYSLNIFIGRQAYLNGHGYITFLMLEEIVTELKRDIDLAFLFGLQYIAGGLENVISEMHRILKPEGVLSFEKKQGV
jgi:SAM-dependent methyltransferase